MAPSSIERVEKDVHFKDSLCHHEDSSFGWMKAQGAYPSLEAAIAAAINADMDLDGAVIEKENGVQASVNDWIAVRTAGGDLDVG